MQDTTNLFLLKCLFIYFNFKLFKNNVFFRKIVLTYFYFIMGLNKLLNKKITIIIRDVGLIIC